jgi:hypothetical protein
MEAERASYWRRGNVIQLEHFRRIHLYIISCMFIHRYDGSSETWTAMYWLAIFCTTGRSAASNHSYSCVYTLPHTVDPINFAGDILRRNGFTADPLIACAPHR